MLGPSAVASPSGSRFQSRGPQARAGSCGEGVLAPLRAERSYHHRGSSRDPQRRLNSWGPEPGVERPKLKVRNPAAAARSMNDQYSSTLGRRSGALARADAHVTSTSLAHWRAQPHATGRPSRYAQPNQTSSGNTSAIVSNRSEEHTSELQSQSNLVCRLLLEKNQMKQFEAELLKEDWTRVPPDAH